MQTEEGERLEVDRGIGLVLHLHVGVKGKAVLTVLQMVVLFSPSAPPM